MNPGDPAERSRAGSAVPAPPRSERAADGQRGWLVAGAERPPAAGLEDRRRSQAVRLSVVVVVRDRAGTVADDLAAVLSRLDPDDELVVVDDASRDDTVANARAVADARVRVFGLVAPRGSAWAISFGLVNAWGRLVAVPTSSGAPDVVAPGGAADVVSTAEAVVAGDALAGVSASGVAGWRVSLLGRAGFLDTGVDDPVRDWVGRVRGAFVPRVLVDDGSDRTGSRGLPPRGRGPARSAAARTDGPVAFPPRDGPVTATLASVPWRRSHLERVVRGLLPQVDRVGVFLDGYTDVPDVLDHPRVWVARSQEHGNLRDNGKFLFADRLPRGYHVTVDDDIDYPSDHVDQLVARVEQYDRRAVVGFHGAIVTEPVEAYFGPARSVRHFSRALATDEAVHVLGSGTTAMHTDTLRLRPSDLPTTGMADVWLAVAAHARGIPMVAVSRADDSLRALPDDGPTLFHEFHRGDDVHVEALRSVTLSRPDVLARPFPVPATSDRD